MHLRPSPLPPRASLCENRAPQRTAHTSGGPYASTFTGSSFRLAHLKPNNCSRACPPPSLSPSGSFHQQEYTNPRAGVLNLAVGLPASYVPPDLGPKSYIAYGKQSESPPHDSVTRLHEDMSDAVNVMLYSVDAQPAAQRASPAVGSPKPPPSKKAGLNAQSTGRLVHRGRGRGRAKATSAARAAAAGATSASEPETADSSECALLMFPLLAEHFTCKTLFECILRCRVGLFCRRDVSLIHGMGGACFIARDSTGWVALDKRIVVPLRIIVSNRCSDIVDSCKQHPRSFSSQMLQTAGKEGTGR